MLRRPILEFAWLGIRLARSANNMARRASYRDREAGYSPPIVNGATNAHAYQVCFMSKVWFMSDSPRDLGRVLSLEDVRGWSDENGLDRYDETE